MIYPGESVKILIIHRPPLKKADDVREKMLTAVQTATTGDRNSGMSFLWDVVLSILVFIFVMLSFIKKWITLFSPAGGAKNAGVKCIGKMFKEIWLKIKIKKFK